MHAGPAAFIERPAIEGRQLFWLAALHRVNGMLYYRDDIWAGQCPTDRACDLLRRVNETGFTNFDPATWPSTKLPGGANGEGSFLYPGETGPLASLRLVNIADGIEDWSLLSRLSNNNSKDSRLWVSGAADLISRVVWNATVRNSDPWVLEGARQEAAARVLGNMGPG